MSILFLCILLVVVRPRPRHESVVQMMERRHAVAKIRKVESRVKRTWLFFYAETEYLRYAVAKLRKVESRAERTLFFFYAETEYLRYAVAKLRKNHFDFIVR